MAGRHTELLDLQVAVVEVLGGRLDQDGEVQRLQPVHEATRVFGGDDEIWAVAGDRLDVGLEAGELGPGRARRVVRLVVHGGDLGSGADREQHLGRRWRQ